MNYKLLIAITSIIIIVSIILYYIFRKRVYHATLFEGPQLLTQGFNKLINFDKMKPSTNGLKYTYMFWLYNVNMPENGYWQNGYDNPKPIFTHFYSPNVYYIPNKNILRVSIGYKNNIGAITGYNLDIKDLKYQLWQHVAIVVDNRIVSVYLNGILDKAANIPNVPWIANRMLNIGKANNNYNGYIWNLNYYNDSLSSTNILKNYNKNKSKIPKLNNSYYQYFKEHQKK